MVKKANNVYSQLYLAKRLEGEVEGWVNEGYPGVTQTKRENDLIKLMLMETR
jgi:hypothetical protein